ncbi:MAG: sodium:solute symporter [Gracilibacteraceae bacterium]|jgi:SSS family solute:Na+ symporter|nr:sodium:solute symporter [Gracilibacteraceae bacterium]
MFAKTFLLIIFIAVMAGVGVYSRKKALDVSGFVLGGRNMGPWMTAFAYGTTYFSAVVFVGYAGQFGWRYGIAATWIGLGNAFIGCLLAWVVLGRRTRVMTNHIGSATMPDFFGARYNSPALKIVSSAIIFVFLIPYTSSIYNGLSLLFGMAFDAPYWACVLVMAALTAVYVVLGGYVATTINDFIQGLIMLLGVGCVVWATLAGRGGFMAALRELAEIPSDAPATFGQPGAFVSFFGPDPQNLLGVIILTSLGTWGLPQMVHKFYTIRSEKAIAAGTIISTLFAVIISCGCYFLGGFSRLFDDPSLYGGSGAVAYDRVIPFMLSALPDILIGLIVILVLSASMSTLSSLVITSSSTLTLDFLGHTVLRGMSEKTKLLLIRVFVVVFITVCTLLALDPPTFIAQLMGISWGALAGSFLAPFLYGLYWKRVSRAAVWASFAFGVGLTVSNMFLKFFASPINAGACAMLIGLLLTPLVSLIFPNRDREAVERIFSCYNEKTEAPQRLFLPEQNGRG